jgi:hypothetical protein
MSTIEQTTTTTRAADRIADGELVVRGRLARR